MQITHSLAMGGLQQVLYNLCRHIDRSLFEVSVVALKELDCLQIWQNLMFR